MTDFSKVKANMEGYGFKVSVFDTKEEACAFLAEELAGKSIGIGGSKTVEAIGLYEALEGKSEIKWHWKAGIDPDHPEEIVKERDDAMHTEVYISSANAIAETGEIINIDGAGNRISSTLWGHRKVIFVIGANKLCPTYDDALWRARNVAAPLRAQSVNAKTPCAAKGDKCYDCKSPARICKGMATIWRPMNFQEFEVVFIDEDLGM